MNRFASLPFIERYATSFGRRQALLLRLSGLLEAEVDASGAVVRDASGKEWLDFGSFGIHLLGHRHPAIVAAAEKQLGLMGLSTKILGNAVSTECAEAIIEATPQELNRVVFANSGAEAVDISLKLAFLATGRRDLVALRHSYHGKTLGALSLSDSLRDQHALGSNLKVHFIEAGDSQALGRMLESKKVAAVYMEPIQGEGGIRPIEHSFIQESQRQCRSTGTVFVMDEIQTGLGRCGSMWRSAARAEPDVLLIGKTLGGGLLPISAIAFSNRIIPEKSGDPVLLASSFAGGSLATRIGKEVVTLVSSSEFLSQVNALGEQAKSMLEAALKNRPEVIDIRGEGLMLGVEFQQPAITGHTVMEAATRGTLLTFCLHNPSVLRFYPPASCTSEQLERGISAVVDSILKAIEITENTPKVQEV